QARLEGQLEPAWQCGCLSHTSSLALGTFSAFRRRRESTPGGLRRRGRAPAARGLSRDDSAPCLQLVGILPVPSIEIGERHRERLVLHLPYVTELVRDQILADVAAAQEDHEMRRV